jgi:hypothetical protein
VEMRFARVTPALVVLAAFAGAACGARTPLDAGGLQNDGGGPGTSDDSGVSTTEAGIGDDSGVSTTEAGIGGDSGVSTTEAGAGDDSGVSTSDAPEETTTVATPPPDFVWYRLDETSGTTAHDSSPNHYDMTNLNGVAWGNGAIFDGASVCGSTSVDQASRTAPVTLTVWVTPQARSDESSTGYALTPFPPNAFCGDSPGLGGFCLGANVWTDGTPGSSIGIETGVISPAAYTWKNFGTLQSGERYFLALAVGPMLATLYVNGVMATTIPADTPAFVTPAPLHLGCTNDDMGYLTKRFFEGTLRDARMYTRLVGAPEIAQLFANGPV